MNSHILLAIAKKDLLEVRQNKAAWAPMIIVPLMFIFFFPLLIMVLPQLSGQAAAQMINDPDFVMMFDRLPPIIMDKIAGMDAMQSIVVMMLGYFFAPFFLIFPLMFSTTVAAESFAGERERKTMEALLYTPASDAELFFGKMIAGLIPALLISWISFFLYTFVLNAAGWPLFGHLWFPLVTWYPLIFWVTPALAVMGVGMTVLISSKVQTFMGAYQASASLVIVVVGLLIGQFAGVVYLNVGVGMIIGLVAWIIAGGMVFFSYKNFNRAKLLVSST
jgi:ABC-type Na+ efflux pump permease subunit